MDGPLVSDELHSVLQNDIADIMQEIDALKSLLSEFGVISIQKMQRLTLCEHAYIVRTHEVATTLLPPAA